MFVGVNTLDKFAFPWMENFSSYQIYEPAEQELILRMVHKSELESFENVPPSPPVTHCFLYNWLVVHTGNLTLVGIWDKK
jgi:hypothetical protein